MGHKLKLRKNTKNGFTIVELLIVVVVIAILAAITIVAYNGIQTRAKDAQLVSAVNEYVKGIKAYQNTKGDIPYNGVACFDGTSCWSGSSAAVAEELRVEMRTVMGQSLPNIPAPYAALIAKGVTLDNVNGGTYDGLYVLYQHSDTGSCRPIGGARFLNNSSGSGIRTCRAAIE